MAKYTLLLRISFVITLFITIYFTIASSIGDKVIKDKIRSILDRELNTEYKIDGFTFENSRIEFFLKIDNRRVGRISGRLSIFRLSILSEFEVKDFKSSWFKRFNNIGYFSAKGEFSVSPLQIEIDGRVEKRDEQFNALYKKSFITGSEDLKWSESRLKVNTLNNLFDLNWSRGVDGAVIGTGRLSGDLSEIDEVEGNVSLQINGYISRNRLLKMLPLQGVVPQNLPFSLSTDTVFDDGDIYSFTLLKSEVVNLKSEKMFYSHNENYFKSDLYAKFETLEKFGELIGVEMLGTLDLKGEVEGESGVVQFRGRSEKLKGGITITSEAEKVEYHFEKILFDKMLTILRFYPYIHGESTIKLSSDGGKLSLSGSVNDLTVENNFVLNQLSKIFNLDIQNSLFKSLSFSGGGSFDLFKFDMNLSHQNAIFSMSDSYIDGEKNRIKAPLRLYQNSKAIAEILLYGDASNPFIELRVTKENLQRVKSFIRQESQQSGYLKEIEILLQLFE